MASAHSQKMKLLKHLQTYRSITSLEATQKYYILRPSNRISELKEQGYPIIKETIWKKKDDGSMTHYARYTLLGA